MGKMSCILPPACNHTSPKSAMKWNRNLEAVRLWTRVVTSFIYKKQKKTWLLWKKTKQKHNQDLKKFNTEKCTLPQSCDTDYMRHAHAVDLRFTVKALTDDRCCSVHPLKFKSASSSFISCGGRLSRWASFWFISSRTWTLCISWRRLVCPAAGPSSFFAVWRQGRKNAGGGGNY